MKKNFYQKWWFWVIMSFVLIIFIAQISVPVDYDNPIIVETVSKEILAKNDEYKNLISKIDGAKKQYDDLEKGINEFNKEIAAKKDVITKIENYSNNKEQLEKELISKQKEVTQLNTIIEKKQIDLESYNKEIVKVAKEPTIIPAGQHTVGDLVRPGRYLVTGKYSHFAVYSKGGGLKVNIILGGGNYGVDEYACNLSEGDQIEAGSRTTFTPILN